MPDPYKSPQSPGESRHAFLLDFSGSPARDPHEVARALIALATTARDPRPLLDAARALFDQYPPTAEHGSPTGTSDERMGTRTFAPEATSGPLAPVAAPSEPGGSGERTEEGR